MVELIRERAMLYLGAARDIADVRALLFVSSNGTDGDDSSDIIECVTVVLSTRPPTMRTLELSTWTGCQEYHI